MDRLQELLDLKDEELAKLQKQLSAAVDKFEGYEMWVSLAWMVHEDIKDKGLLPVPRFEMKVEVEAGGFRMKWTERLVYRHFLGHAVAIPFNQTVVGCSQWAFERDGGGLQYLVNHLPYRDGPHFKHDALTFGYPAYISYEASDGLVSTYEVPREMLEKKG